MKTIKKYLRKSLYTSAKTDPKASSHTSTNGKSHDKEDSIIEGQASQLVQTNEPIPDTPFRVIQINDDTWFAILGNNRITQPCKTKKEVLKAIQNPDWHIYCNVMVTIAKQIQDIADRANNTNQPKQNQ